MPKSSNQKSKLLYLAELLMRETDETHGITVADMIQYLKLRDIRADRKTIYDDMEELRKFGYDIVSEQRDRSHYYHLAGREFELPELRLLADSVHAAHFITERKSRELIEKIGGLASRHEAARLSRQVYLCGSGKAENESIYYNVDAIHEAIASDAQIRFQYFSRNNRKEAVLRHGGSFYEISPWTLVWDDEFYYLVGFDENAGMLKHFRVDKMKSISVLSDRRRAGGEAFEAVDLRTYTGRMFGMFAGEEETVTIEGSDRMADVILDHFGTEIFMEPLGEDRFRAVLKVSVSDQFLGWFAALGEGVRIIAPENVAERMRQMGERLMRMYGKD